MISRENEDILEAFCGADNELSKHRAKHELAARIRETHGKTELLLMAATSASSLDKDRLKFYETKKAAQARLKYKDAADLWNQKEHDCCDEVAFKQSCYRARKNVTK